MTRLGSSTDRELSPGGLPRRAFLAGAAASLGIVATASAVFAESRDAAQRVGESLAERLGRLGEGADPRRLARDERFWADLRQEFDLSPDTVNLDHGWTNPPPRAAMDDLVAGARELEALPAEVLASLWFEVTNTTVRAAVAEAMGVPGEEIALVRNATEALDTVLLGVPLQPGDEVVCSTHDYYAMLDALDQRRARDGIVLKQVRPPLPASSLDQLVTLYEQALGPRTKLVLLTHPSNLTGQLLPVARIAAAAHRVGAEVVVDGAQSLGLLADPVASLGCDYYGASLHKWLGAPVGTGVLWMQPRHATKVWPLLPPAPGTTGMSRFEWIGTSPEYVGPAILPALAVQRALGPERKAARLRYLGGLWRARVAAALPESRFYTLPDEEMRLGLSTVEIPGQDPGRIQQRLRREHGVLVKAMAGSAWAPEIRGLRVSPNVFTSPAELDRFVAGLATVVGG